MTVAAVASPSLKFLEDRWDPAVADRLDEPGLLRYRSNLLGSDLRLTNFAGGNTSSKIDEVDPLTGQTAKVLWVKGSGGDLGSIKRNGFATLYMDKLLALEHLYRGQDSEDEMVEMYALCSFRNNPVASSIDTPLHGFLPFPHVDHLHPEPGTQDKPQDSKRPEDDARQQSNINSLGQRARKRSPEFTRWIEAKLGLS